MKHRATVLEVAPRGAIKDAFTTRLCWRMAVGPEAYGGMGDRLRLTR